MARFGFFFDMGKCIGCKACQTACKDRHGLEPGLFYRRVAVVRHAGNERFFSGACNHCANPACVRQCPAGAARILDDGTIGRDAGRCIGCGACEWSCPYGAPKLGAAKGFSQKCPLCPDLRGQGRNPACVDACITHCLRYGDLDSLLAESGLERVRPDFLPKTDTDPGLVVVDSRSKKVRR